MITFFVKCLNTEISVDDVVLVVAVVLVLVVVAPLITVT
jgi:hypothetical protein